MTDSTITRSRMRCTATGSFSVVVPQYNNIPIYITVYIPLSPGQFQQLCDSARILPNPYNGIFHLRSNQMLAVQKAREHMIWKDDGRGNIMDQKLCKKWYVCILKIFTLGYMILKEQGVLRKNVSKDGHYGHGPIWKQSFTLQDGVQQTLYQIQDELKEVV